MKLETKQQAVKDLALQFSQAQAAYVVSCQGTKCNDLTRLRRKLQSTGAHFAVVKNTLLKRAVLDTEAKDLSQYFNGASAIIWSGKDPIAPAKIISEFSSENEAFKIKAAVFDGEVLTDSGIEELSKMPNREVLLSSLLALINTPATKLLQTINAPASSLARALEAWRVKLENKVS